MAMTRVGVRDGIKNWMGWRVTLGFHKLACKRSLALAWQPATRQSLFLQLHRTHLSVPDPPQYNARGHPQDSQQGASGYTAQGRPAPGSPEELEALKKYAESNIYPIFWPAFSPDLNPIETVWNRMKDYIMRRYPDYHSSYEKLRRAVKEAWDAIGAE